MSPEQPHDPEWTGPDADNTSAPEGFREANILRDLAASDRTWPDDAKTRQIAHEANKRIGTHSTPKIVDYTIGMAVLHHEVPDLILQIPEYYRKTDAHILAPENDRERRQLMNLRDTDALTGLGSVRALNKALPAAEADPNVFVANFDANNFGDINKLHGELAGDAAILGVAESIYQAAAAEGYGRRIFRRGGDEFVVLAPPEIAQRIVDEACRIFDERIASDKPFELKVVRDGDVTGDTRYFDSEIFRGIGLSLSGVVGKTHEETSLAIKAVKDARKAQDITG